MRKILKERRNEIKKAVLNIFSNPDFAQFPVPVKKIAKSFPNCRLIRYSVMAQKYNLSIAQFARSVETQDAYTDYDSDTNRYLIVYNDTNPIITSSYRYRWNIAHEIGHMVLKHHINRTDCRLCRNTISDADYKYLEEEADLFANYLLVPYAALAVRHIQNSNDLRKLCKISVTASNYQISEYSKWSHNDAFKCRYDQELARCFYDHVKCKKCAHILHVHDRKKFCPICGNNEFLFYYTKERIHMKYRGIALNDKFKAVKCPRCGNEETDIDGDYCQICGTMIANRCTSHIAFGTDYCPGSEGLDGNARFCPHCGSTSTFLDNGILSPWEDVSSAPQLTKKLSEDLDTNDLPF